MFKKSQFLFQEFFNGSFTVVRTATANHISTRAYNFDIETGKKWWFINNK